MMSSQRYACIDHRAEIFRDITKISTKSISPKQNKQTHAELAYERSLNGETKTIVSNRLGISFTSQIMANSTQQLHKLKQPYMYYKYLSNFNFVVPKNVATARKQAIRRLRNERRLLTFFVKTFEIGYNFSTGYDLPIQRYEECLTSLCLMSNCSAEELLTRYVDMESPINNSFMPPRSFRCSSTQLDRAAHVIKYV